MELNSVSLCDYEEWTNLLSLGACKYLTRILPYASRKMGRLGMQHAKAGEE